MLTFLKINSFLLKKQAQSRSKTVFKLIFSSLYAKIFAGVIATYAVFFIGGVLVKVVKEHQYRSQIKKEFEERKKDKEKIESYQLDL